MQKQHLSTPNNIWYKHYPHNNITKHETKISTPLLSTIKPSHLKNSDDLLNKTRNINIENQPRARLDIQSLFRNIPVQKCILQMKIQLEIKKKTSSIMSLNSLK